MLGFESTAEQTPGVTNTGLSNHEAFSGCIFDVRDVKIPKDQLNGMLEVIDSALGAISPGVGTAREFRDDERQVCKLGLELLNRSLKGL